MPANTANGKEPAMADKYDEMAQRMRADGVDEEGAKDEFLRGCGTTDIEAARTWRGMPIEEMPSAEKPSDPAYLDSLMPWSESVPTGTRLKPKASEEAARMADDPIIDIDPLGLPRRRGIAETSRSFLDRNGKTPEVYRSTRLF